MKNLSIIEGDSRSRSLYIEKRSARESCVRTDSDERSTQSEIYETSDNPTQSRAETTARPTRPTVRPDRLVFPIYRKYLIPNKPSQTKPNQKPTEQAQETQPKQAGANRRQGRTRIHREYLLTLAALPTSTATSDVQSKYSVAAAAAAETKLLTVCQFVIPTVRYVRPFVNGKTRSSSDVWGAFSYY